MAEKENKLANCMFISDTGHFHFKANIRNVNKRACYMSE